VKSEGDEPWLSFPEPLPERGAFFVLGNVVRRETEGGCHMKDEQNLGRIEILGVENLISPYIEKSKQNVKRSISDLLNATEIERVAREAFSYNFGNNRSLSFQHYYRETIENREKFLSTPDFFRHFKQRYALQGIDSAYLDKLESEKETILHLLDSNDLVNLYYRFFADALVQRGERVVKKNLGSFFTKLVHTFLPDRYCALDNPVKKYFGLGNESFFIAFIVVSKAYREWASENWVLMQQIRMEIERNKTGKLFSIKMTDLKLLDLIFWYQANESR